MDIGLLLTPESPSAAGRGGVAKKGAARSEAAGEDGFDAAFARSGAGAAETGAPEEAAAAVEKGAPRPGSTSAASGARRSEDGDEEPAAGGAPGLSAPQEPSAENTAETNFDEVGEAASPASAPSIATSAPIVDAAETASASGVDRAAPGAAGAPGQDDPERTAAVAAAPFGGAEPTASAAHAKEANPDVVSQSQSGFPASENAAPQNAAPQNAARAGSVTPAEDASARAEDRPTATNPSQAPSETADKEGALGEAGTPTRTGVAEAVPAQSEDKSAATAAATVETAGSGRVPGAEADPRSGERESGRIGGTGSDRIGSGGADAGRAADHGGQGSGQDGAGNSGAGQNPGQNTGQNKGQGAEGGLGQAGLAEAGGARDRLEAAFDPGLGRGAGPGSAAPASGGAPQAAPATGAAVSAQVAAAVQARGDERRIVLQLDPVELGRVSIELNFNDDALTVSVRAERQEALDLMRRHGADLERQLREAGLDFDSLSFGAEQRDEGGWGQDRGAPRDGFAYLGAARLEAETAAGMQTAAQNLRVGAGGVDLRV